MRSLKMGLKNHLNWSQKLTKKLYLESGSINASSSSIMLGNLITCVERQLLTTASISTSGMAIHNI